MSEEDLGVLHFIVFVHGYGGSEKEFLFHRDKIEFDFKRAKDVHSEKLNSHDLLIFMSKKNGGMIQSGKGIRVCGEKLIEELVDVFKTEKLEEEEREIRLSFIAHSFGGILVRYVIGELLTREETSEMFQKLVLWGYYTLATPHLGVRSRMWGFNCFLCLTSKTTSDLSMFTEDSEKIMKNLADEDGKYIPILKKFKFKSLFGSDRRDYQVGFPTSLVSRRNPHSVVENSGKLVIIGSSGYNDEFDKVLDEWDLKGLAYLDEPDYNKSDIRDDDENEREFRDDSGRYIFDKKMYLALRKIDWRRLVIQIAVNNPIYPVHFYYVRQTKIKSIANEGEKLIRVLRSIVLFDHGIIEKYSEIEDEILII